jgi:hypothetical protein
MNETLQELVRKRNEAAHEFCDRIVTLAMGLLGITVAFRTSVIGSNPYDVWLIKIAWVSFSACGITGIAWRYSKITILRIFIRELAKGAAKVSAAPSPLFVCCFWTCLLAFMVGIVALTIFGFLNT